MKVEVINASAAKRCLTQNLIISYLIKQGIQT